MGGNSLTNVDSLDANAVSTGSLISVSDVVIRPDDDPQTKINNANSGDVISANPLDTHTVSSTVEVTTDDVTIVGLGLTLADTSDVPVLKIHNCSGVTVRNARIDGNRTNQTANQFNQTVNGITITNAESITIEGGEVFDCLNQGILATSYDNGSADAGDVKNVTIENVDVDNSGNGGVIFAGGGSNISRGGVLSNCTVTNADNEHIQAIDGYDYVTFENNRVEGNTPGIAIESHTGRGATDQLGFSIIGNHIEVDANAVLIDRNNLRQDGIIISNNTFNILGTGNRGVLMDGSKADFLTISNNHFRGKSTYETDSLVGVRIENGAVINNCNVVGNTFYQLNRGIYFDNVDVPAQVVANVGEEIGILVRFVDTPDAAAAYNSGLNLNGSDNDLVRIETSATSTQNGNKAIGNHVTNGDNCVTTSGSVDYYIIKNNTSKSSNGTVSDGAGGANAIVKDNIGY